MIAVWGMCRDGEMDGVAVGVVEETRLRSGLEAGV
jgi:hypothetical protein